MSIFIYTNPPNNLRSKKAITRRRGIPATNMNCQITYILHTFPLRPSASCGRAHFVFFKTFLKNFSIPFGKSAVRPWKAAERG